MEKNKFSFPSNIGEIEEETLDTKKFIDLLFDVTLIRLGDSTNSDSAATAFS